MSIICNKTLKIYSKTIINPYTIESIVIGIELPKVDIIVSIAFVTIH